MPDKITVFWFRRDLRLEDNKGLFLALNEHFPVLPVFIFDTNILNDLDDKSDSRITFIIDALKIINKKLIKYNSGIKVLIGTPLNAFQSLVKEYDIHKVYTNTDYEPYAIQRDQEIASFLKSRNIEFQSEKDQVIFEKTEVLNNSGQPYKVYTPYKNKWKELFKKDSTKEYPSDAKLDNIYKLANTELPELGQLGFKPSALKIPPFIFDQNLIKNYHLTRNNPSLPTSRIGVHLRFGTISIRKAIQIACELNETWLDELIWREFFMQLLYNFPNSATEPFHSKFSRLEWINDEEQFDKWCNGLTGYPMVDAGMRELNATGFMHNRVRMVAASFLTKHLLINWTWGEQYFASKLLDYEMSSNVGNWQWVAGTGADAQPFIRVFNPELQAKRFDPDLTYIKTWIPEIDSEEYPKPIVNHKEAVKRTKMAFENL
ncbi:MAG: cryptochrome/photolyase family protein [Cytophagaceae bacterium]